MPKRATIPPIASPVALSRLLIGLLWVVPLLYFAYNSLLSRWPEGDVALASAGHGPCMIVGVATQRGQNDDETITGRSQVYLCWPESVRTLDAYAVVQDNHGTRTRALRLGLLMYGGLYGVWIAGSVWYLVKRSRA